MELADRECFKVIAIPGMGTGVGGVPKEVAAKAMVEEIRNFEPKCLEKVILVDIDDEMVEAWERVLKLR